MAYDFNNAFTGKNALITGGMGFIGSNLAMRLVDLGANVTIIDAMLPEYGGNPFNISMVADRVKVNYSDIRDHYSINFLIKDQDFVFHLAGQVDHILSLQNPFPDIDINIHGTAVLMEAVRKEAPEARVVYTGTRGQYGPTVELPVSEDTPMNPKGLYELSNLTAEKIVQLYHDHHEIPACMLRLTNIYGPRAQMQHSRYGVVNWFIRVALDGGCIKVFGKGDLMRDFVFVDDAVDSILLASSHDDAIGQVFNVGVDQPSNFLELAKTIVEVAGCGSWEFAPFSPERAAQEPGHFFSDITKIKKALGWTAKTPLRAGLGQTVEYYRTNKEHYWND